MIGEGMVTIMVSNMKRSLDFYRRVLGFKVETVSKGKWAEISGHKLYVGLHLDEDMKKMKRQRGSGNFTLGFEAKGGIDKEAAALRKKRVKVEMEDDEYAGLRFASFKDPDGNDLYLWEWM